MATAVMLFLAQLSVSPRRVRGFAPSARCLQAVFQPDQQAVRVFDGAVPKSICTQLDRTAAAMGGGHVLFDRQQPAASPIEQIVDRCLSKADDTSRYFLALSLSP